MAILGVCGVVKRTITNYANETGINGLSNAGKASQVRHRKQRIYPIFVNIYNMQVETNWLYLICNTISQKQEKCRLVAWLIIFFLGGAATIWNVYYVFHDYFEYEVTTSISIEQNTVVCNNQG